MNERLAILTDSEQVQTTLRDVDTLRLIRELGVAADSQNGSTANASRLRVAATIALADLLGGNTVDDYLKQAAPTDTTDPRTQAAVAVFRKWCGYFDAMVESGRSITADDLMFFATAGLLANRPTEVRSVLRQAPNRDIISEAIKTSLASDWSRRVRGIISVALLLLVLQADHNDVAQAGRLLQNLAKDQKQFESEWLDRQPDSSRDALALLGYYHLGQAVVRTSEFLLLGGVTKNGRVSQGFGPELGRLLVKAEEYFALSNHAETLHWLRAVSILLWRLRTDSIWVSGLGISERLDQLIAALAREGREQPVFSLLPSQQEALRKNLLDPTRVAVILQMPTSAGKTLLAEFAIVQAFEAYRQGTKVVYVVPTRALATQVRRTLAEDLRPLGIEVSAAGSAFEEDPYELELLEKSDGVIVSTPEKLDLLLRAHPKWFDNIRLVVVDEAHLLKDSERGVKLELLLANLRREQPRARLLLLTPFMQNSADVATWLGGERGTAIDVQWRPSRILLGIASIAGRGANRALMIEWREPYDPNRVPNTVRIPTDVPSTQVQSSLNKVVFLASQFRHLGAIMAMFAGSREDAETAATRLANQRDDIPADQQTPALRVAIALAKNDYGADSVLATCLERGVAFHHSSLSSMLRYLIEDQVRAKTIDFIAATSTLAQGMNFPVAAVLVHSVVKPRGAGAFTPSEFWNIAGRAGRVGMVDRGLVIFADTDDREKWERYSEQLTDHLKSALLQVISQAGAVSTLKELYQRFPEIRPFLQYLAHAAANATPAEAAANLEELLQASLANRQTANAADAQALRSIARSYLATIQQKEKGYLKTADETGLGSFSFDELFAKIGADPLLLRGPTEIIRRKQDGIYHLIDALRWLPELDLAIGMGAGKMDVRAVAAVVQGWIDGKPIHELAARFPGGNTVAKVRNAGTYIFGKVSQTVSWGAHAYVRGWLMRQPKDSELRAEDAMLPAYIQYGVNTPEAAVASLLNVPRQFAESFASEYRDNHGSLKAEETTRFKQFVETAEQATWDRVVARSPLAGSVRAADMRRVWRQMQGFAG